MRKYANSKPATVEGLNFREALMTTGKTRSATTIESAVSERVRILAEKINLVGLVALDRELRDLNDELASSELVHAMLDVVRLWDHVGHASEAKEVSDKAIWWSSLLNDPSLIGSAHNCRAGIALFEMDIGAAVTNLVQALAAASARNDIPATVRYLRNIGVCCGRLGMNSLQTRLAQAGLNRLKENWSILPSKEAKLAECFCDLAVAEGLLRTGDLGLALQTFHRVNKAGSLLLRSPDLDAMERSQLSLSLRQAKSFELSALVQLGLVDDAKKLADTVRSALIGESSPINAFDAEWALAELLVLEGYPEKAIARIEGLIDNQLSGHAKIELMFSLAKCYESAGRNEEALSVLADLDTYVRSMRDQATFDALSTAAVLRGARDNAFESELRQRVTRLAAAREGDQSRSLVGLARLIEIAVAAELDETPHPNGVWHAIRVGTLARLTAEEIGFDTQICWQAELAGLLHDVGKCIIPDRMKVKEAPLSKDEYHLIQEHAEFGARLVESLGDQSLAPIALAIRHHHERLDGGGYPAGLSGDQIPVLARVVTLCESFDAMMLPRSFRPARSFPEALAEVIAKAGAHFDSDIVNVFVRVVRRLEGDFGCTMAALEALGRESSRVEAFEQISSLLASLEGRRTS